MTSLDDLLIYAHVLQIAHCLDGLLTVCIGPSLDAELTVDENTLYMPRPEESRETQQSKDKRLQEQLRVSGFIEFRHQMTAFLTLADFGNGVNDYYRAKAGRIGSIVFLSCTFSKVGGYGNFFSFSLSCLIRSYE